MSEELKKYFKENMEDINIDNPPSDLWAKIELELDKKKDNEKVVSLFKNKELKKSKSKIFGSWLKAAAILLFTFGLGYFVANDKRWEKKLAKIEVSEIDLARINADMIETEYFYMSNIQTVTQELKDFHKDQPDLVLEFLMEQQSLVDDYNELKLHLIDNADNEQIIELMIENLRLQNDILIQQKNLLQNIASEKSFEYSTSKNKKSLNDEKVYL